MIQHFISNITIRYMFGENRDVANEMMEKHNPDLMGKVALALFKHHRNQQITYQLDQDAESLYETIFDKYNAQFNLKYSGITLSF